MTHGPLAGDNELVAGFAMIKVKSMEDAIALARRFTGVLGDVEIEIGPVVEPWVEELTKAGVLLKVEGLAPSAKGARLASGAKGKRTWVDGPFSESKELIAGFSILNAWANRYAAILGDNEVDVRVVLDGP